MAKKDEKKYLYPSRFGSHRSMVNEEKTAELGKEGYVVCTDEYGDYVTSVNRLDDGGLDSKRSNGLRIKYEKEKHK